MGWESMANALCNVGLSLGFSNFFCFTSACHCNPFVILVLSFLRCPRAPSFAARIILLRIPAQFCRKFDAWLEIYFELIADQLEAVSLNFLFPMHLSGMTRWGFLQWYFLQWGHVLFFNSSSMSFSFFFFSRVLAFLGFLCSHSRDLRRSSDEPLSELAPYVDLVYSKLVSLFSIIELKNDAKLATECAVPAFGAGASHRALTSSSPASSIKIVWSDIASYI